jgi:hypothetical protein
MFYVIQESFTRYKPYWMISISIMMAIGITFAFLTGDFSWVYAYPIGIALNSAIPILIISYLRENFSSDGQPMGPIWLLIAFSALAVLRPLLVVLIALAERK